MNKRLHVGNLPFSATEDELRESFSQIGKVESVKIILDRDTGRSKGFAFVEMSSESEAAQIITAFNGAPMGGRSLKISFAKPKEPR